MNYILKNGDHYLSDITTLENIITNKRELINFTIDNDYRKLYNDFEKAEDDRKLIFIETGLNLTVKRFKEKKEE